MNSLFKIKILVVYFLVLFIASLQLAILSGCCHPCLGDKNRALNLVPIVLAG